MDTVLFLSNANRFVLTPQIRGIRSFARTASWSLHTVGDVDSPAKVKSLLRFWDPIGCIVHDATGRSIFRASLFKDIPLVFMDRNPAVLGPGQNCVMHDSAQAGLLAAKELLSLDLPNYAYVRYSPRWFWCREREFTFVEEIRKAGRKYFTFSDSSEVSRNERLKTWLVSLPKPVGIFATNDGVSEKIALSAKELGLDIPDDIALLGVDDVEVICEESHPTLSSIHPDFIKSGYLAAELLSRVIADPSIKGTIVRYGQTGVVRRQSTSRYSKIDSIVSGLLESIRTRATDPTLSIASLAAECGCSRRYADMRFRRTTGKTILEEIHSVRVDIAKRLLENPDARIGEVARESGFASFATFSRVFSALVGKSPREYRAIPDGALPNYS